MTSGISAGLSETFLHTAGLQTLSWQQAGPAICNQDHQLCIFILSGICISQIGEYFGIYRQRLAKPKHYVEHDACNSATINTNIINASM